MAKIKQIGKTKVYSINCPACNLVHNINCNPELNGAWTYVAGPTFKPAVRIQNRREVCEFSIAEGQIFFTKNSTHKLQNQNVELPEIKNTL